MLAQSMGFAHEAVIKILGVLCLRACPGIGSRQTQLILVLSPYTFLVTVKKTFIKHSGKKIFSCTKGEQQCFNKPFIGAFFIYKKERKKKKRKKPPKETYL